MPPDKGVLIIDWIVFCSKIKIDIVPTNKIGHNILWLSFVQDSSFTQQMVVERTQSKLFHTFSEFQIFKISMHLGISTLFYVIKRALLCSCMRNSKTSYSFWARLIKICSLTVVGVGVVVVTFSHFHHLQNHWANFNPLGTKNHWVKGIQVFFLK